MLSAQTTILKNGKEFFNGDDRHLRVYLNNNYSKLDQIEGIWIFTRFEYNAYGQEVSRTPNEITAAIVRDRDNLRRAYIEINMSRAFCKDYQITYNIQTGGGSGYYPCEPQGCGVLSGQYYYDSRYNTISRPAVSLMGNRAVLVGIKTFPQGPPMELLPPVPTENAITSTRQVQAREPHTIVHPSGWEPHIDWDNQIFSSYILSVNTTYSKPIYDYPDYRGDVNSVVGIVIKNPRSNSDVEIEIDPTRYSKGVKETFKLEKKGQQYGVFPKIPWDHELLMCMKEGNKVYFTFKVTINGKEPITQVEEVLLRPIDDCPSFAYDYNGHGVDLRYMFAAYVNEGSPIVGELIKEIKEKGLLRDFVGSSGGPDATIGEVYAFWKILRDKNISYSTIADNGYTTPKVFSQRVRLLEDVLEYIKEDTKDNSVVNCIDGTVMFASCIMPSGIPATIVIIPRHAFLGYKINISDTNEPKWYPLYLETTLLGGSVANLPSYYNEWIQKPIYDYIKNMLYVKFNKGKKTANKEIDYFIAAMMAGELAYIKAMNETPNQVKNIDVADYRTTVSPIHRCEPKKLGKNMIEPIQQTKNIEKNDEIKVVPRQVEPITLIKKKKKGSQTYDDYEYFTYAPEKKGEYYKMQVEITPDYKDDKPEYLKLKSFGRIETEILLPGETKTRVMIGDFTTYEKAIPAAQKAQQLGFKNVAIVRYKDSNRYESIFRDWKTLPK
jgi:hypothetical protein